MRYDDDIGTLTGIHKGRREAFGRMGVDTLADLLRLAPRRYEDRTRAVPIAELEDDGKPALVIGRVTASRAFRTRSGISILEASVRDDSGTAVARWFYRGFVPSALPEDRLLALYGPCKTARDRLELKAPEMERIDDETDGPGFGRIVPVHPRTSGLTTPVIRRAVWEALPAANGLPDPLPDAVRAAQDLPTLGDALAALHFPESMQAAEAARRRLAFDELLVHELLLARRRAARGRLQAVPCRFTETVHERIRARFPFELTAGQEAVIAEITADLERDTPMYRLLQGDVGCGKTAVAVYALLGAIAAGRQVAFMAPTEVLARQHARTVSEMLAGSRVRIEVLAGGARTKDRRERLARIEAGDVDLVIGTHAVISEDVRFAALGLVVVDEQHKFGVRQRRLLVAKGRGDGVTWPHCLVMSATPIPRTLALAVWGDMDVSVIEGTLPGRSPVETWVVRPKEGKRVMDRVKGELAAGRQAYAIYPLVEGSEKVALKDAHAGFERWTRALRGHNVGLLHGRMKRAEKDAVMQAFQEGTIHLLVSTVVVEVGVDVSNATVLIVEHAERFGLSQLHQLRGRIGRGTAGGTCVLVDRSKEDTPARLGVLAASTDGFHIAEEDLKLRGLGDLFGTRQHGRPAFRAATLPKDMPLLAAARKIAHAITAQDPDLTRPDHHGLAALVTHRDAAMPESGKQG